MKKIAVFTLLVAFLGSCNQPNTGTDYERLYAHSMNIKDYSTAIVALQALLQKDSTNQAYLDTLPELYAAVKNFNACEYYTDKALQRDGNSEKYLQLKALCLQQVGDFEGELDIYNKLYESTNKLPYLYQITAYLFSSGQVKEAKANLDELEKLSVNATDSVDFMISETEKQKVPLRAALFNMRAYMSAQNRDLMGAKKYFEMALKEFPDFVTARQNYIQLMQSAQGGR